MEKYTKIFEEASKEKWNNYCAIISYIDEDDNNPDVYLCDNEYQGFIYLKNLIYDEYAEKYNSEYCSKILIEFSTADNLNDLYEIFCSKNHRMRVYLIYCELNEKVELNDWIKDWELKNTASKFNV